MAASAGLNPTGGQMDNGLQVACILCAPRASGIFPNVRPEGLGVHKQQTYDNWLSREEIIHHPLAVVQEDIPDEIANWFHRVKEVYHEQVQDQIWLFLLADWERDAVADELVQL